MFNKFSIIAFQISILLLETTSNLIQPEYAIKIFNKENVILSLGNIDDDTNNDLELVKERPENSGLEKKLYDFHKYINLAEKTERPKLREFLPRNEFLKPLPTHLITYPDSPIEVAVNEKHLAMLERRVKKKNFPHSKSVTESDDAVDTAVQKKRELPKPDTSKDFMEYDHMAQEYLDYLEQSQNKNTAFKYSDQGKPEEGVMDIMKKIVDLRTPKNCTNVTGIGLQRLECIVQNFKDGTLDREQMIYGVLGVILIWIAIYLAIALPLWCTKGWCCCCCRCAFCFPMKTVNEIHKYIADNPPGTYKHTDGREEHYKPTQKETELYEKIRRSIADF